MKKILVLFGSMSSEHEISCISASNVINSLDKEKYSITKVGIDKSGNIFKYFGDVKNIEQNKWIEDDENKERIIDIISELKKYDVVFPVLHGKYGEDGIIQGIIEFAGVKYVGCRVLGSAIAMNKILSKKLVNECNIPIVDYVSLKKGDKILEEEIVKKLGLPVIVKPNREGSSYGVVKVENVDKLKEAIEFSFKYDDEVLIEKYIANRKEVECAVIENEDKVYSSTPGEICFANEVYDFNAKYENNLSYTKIPADISNENIDKIKEYSKVVFRILNLTGIARVDFFVSNDNIYFNEVNTMPGFTSISMYPQMLVNDGIEKSKILDILINNAK